MYKGGVCQICQKYQNYCLGCHKLEHTGSDRGYAQDRGCFESVLNRTFLVPFCPVQRLCRAQRNHLRLFVARVAAAFSSWSAVATCLRTRCSMILPAGSACCTNASCWARCGARRNMPRQNLLQPSRAGAPSQHAYALDAQ